MFTRKVNRNGMLLVNLLVGWLVNWFLFCHGFSVNVHVNTSTVSSNLFARFDFMFFVFSSDISYLVPRCDV